MSDAVPLTPDTTGSNFAIQSYDIAPEDAGLAQSLSEFDPVNDIPSPVQFIGGTVKAPERFTAAMLSPDKRGAILAQVAHLPDGPVRAQREHDLVFAAARRNSLELRIRAGAGDGSTPIQRETLSIARERHELETQVWRIEQHLAEVVRWDAELDPATGGQRGAPVHTISGERRRQMEAHRDQLQRNVASLDGIEGQRRMQKALYQSVEQTKDVRDQLARHNEAKQMADEMNRREQVETMAAAFAKNRRNTLG